MRKLLLALALLGFAGPALAQNTQCSNRPNGDSTNACANTRFVGTAIATTPVLPGNLPAGVDANVLNVQTSNYAIVAGDCGKTIQAGAGSTGQFTVTLPVVAGFPTTCTVNVKNGDTYPGGGGKILSGFPADLDPILYPLQFTSVKIVNGVWATAVDPGRWQNPTTVTWHVDKTNGSNTNDGLAAGAGRALLDAQTANTRAVYKSDTQATTPIIAMACGQTHTTAMNMGGTPLGTNLIQLSPDGNCGFTWTNAGPCISIGDLAELDLNLTFYGASGAATFGCNTSNAASTGNILLHNAVVLDIEGTPIWNPGGANDNFMFCDGDCGFTIANGITQATAATGNYPIVLSAGGKGTQSGTISASGAGAATGLYYVYNGMLIIDTVSGGGWSSLGPSKVYGNGTLVSNGITPAGGLTVGPTGTNCTALTSPTCSTVIGANEVTRANLAQGVARSVIGVAGNATANVADIQGTAGQILSVNPAGTALGFVGPSQTLSATFANPTGSGGANLMMGVGGTCKLTPSYSSRIQLTFFGSASNSGVFGSLVQVRFGTGTAPVNGAAASGTQVGNTSAVSSTAANAAVGVANGGIITGLTPGTAYWFDLSMQPNGGGTASFLNGSCTAMEF